MTTLDQYLSGKPEAAYFASIKDCGILYGWPNGFFHVHWMNPEPEKFAIINIEDFPDHIRGSGLRVTTWNDLGFKESLSQYSPLDLSVREQLKSTKFSNQIFRDIDHCLAIVSGEDYFGRTKTFCYNPDFKHEICHNSLIDNIAYWNHRDLKVSLLASCWIVDEPLTNDRIKNSVGVDGPLEKFITDKNPSQVIGGKLGTLNQANLLNKTPDGWVITQKGINKFGLNSFTEDDRQACIDRAWNLRKNGFTEKMALDIFNRAIPDPSIKLKDISIH